MMEWQTIIAYFVVAIAAGLFIWNAVKSLTGKTDSRKCPGCGDVCGVKERE